ncbi:T9SS sorting signal type C domain-containing protein [Flavobacterium sp. WC2509]|uniref:T9SS sorting signal type C domain-containing protein n=1 Tax=Flavobacterium sp. WC2509 TaxID=3461406 RepID=UPI0040448C1B
MKNFILDIQNIIIVIALVFSFKVSSQAGMSGPNSLQETFHESINVTGNNLAGSSGKISYSIGQIFFTPIGESVSKASQGVQGNYVDQTIWNGSNWDNGTPTSSTDALIIGDYNVSANITASNLTVDNNALTIIPSGFNVNLDEELQVKSGSFTLKNNANLIQTSVGTNSGNINVERESSSLLRLDYTLWSSPVKNDTSFLKAFSPSTSTNRFYTYNTSTNLYNVISNPLTIPFALGQGYLIQMPNDASPTIRTKYLGVFSGVPNNGIFTITLANDGPGKRFNLVGNPYPSPINITQFIADNSTNITPTLYFWRKTSGSGGGSYCTWAGGIFVSNNEPEAFDPNGIIQVGQGFFVEALEPATTVVFNNGQRVANNANQFFKIKAVDRNTIWLNATNTSGAFTQMAVGYTTNATTGVDLFDGKYFNDSAIALNSFLDNTDYVIQGRPLPFDGTDVVPLSFKATNPGDYTIAIDHVDGLFTGLQEIILKDNDNGTETNLKLGKYNFTAAAGTTNSRFSLKFQKTLGISLPDFDKDGVLVYQNQGKINIMSKVSEIKDVKIYDINGRLLFENTNVNTKETSFDSLKFADQVLIAKIWLDDDKLISKKIINQNSVDKH